MLLRRIGRKYSFERRQRLGIKLYRIVCFPVLSSSSQADIKAFNPKFSTTGTKGISNSFRGRYSFINEQRPLHLRTKDSLSNSAVDPDSIPKKGKNTMKKLVCLIMSLCLLVSLAAINASASTLEEAELKNFVQDYLSASASAKYNFTDADLTIRAQCCKIGTAPVFAAGRKIICQLFRI